MPRKVNVATVCMGGYRGGSIAANLDYTLSLLDAACSLHPDVVCLPENFATVGISPPLAEKAQPVPGPVTDACAERARRNRAYVICPLTRKSGGLFLNSAVVIDRGGQIAGIYDKAHPVTTASNFSAAENGMTPGGEPQVFELDFGKIACQICFDLGFPETWALLKRKGAEIVFWPSAYDGGFPLRLYAYLHQYYVVSSVRTNASRIVNPAGDVLEQTDYRLKIASRSIDLDFIICHSDFHPFIPLELVRKYGPDVSVKTHMEEGIFLVETNSDGLPLSRVITEFGLEPSRKYYERHHPLYEALLAGKKPEPQKTPYEGRAQWG
ncbi:MAG TPA: carbon-nitrogen hydrolase family protein [Planctomycetes bacterium]|nr:carbon-nitrogen hydrolase family protein [Planctomycetota bacterium]